MQEFYEDVAQRAALTKRPQYDKKTATMTEKEWRNLNGAVTSYQLNAPKSWEAFKSMPLELQLTYLINMDKAFGISFKTMGDMFGVTGQCVADHCRRYGIHFKPTQLRQRPEQMAAWDKFIAGDTPAPEPQKEEPVAEKPKMTVNRMALKFTGQLSVDEIAAALKLIIGDGIGTVTIDYKNGDESDDGTV